MLLGWLAVLIVIIGGMILALLTGIPVAFAFMLLSLVGSYIFWGGGIGVGQFVVSMFSGVSSFTLLALPLFILMGELLFHSGIATFMFDAISKLMGRLPGKLGVVAVAFGTLLSVLTGSAMAATAILGSLLVPEMEKHGYKKSMTLGPILGSAGLAVMIPPSGLAILVGAIGGISIGALLIGGIVPGLLMAFLYASYIILRCWLQPSIAPPFKETPIPLSEKVLLTVRHVLPIGLVVFLVTGLIFFGVATPSESAATGVLGSLALVGLYKRVNWEVIKKSLVGTLSVTGMIFLIIAGASAFSQILAFSGATAGLVKTVSGLPLPLTVIVMLMLATVIFLGTFMSVPPMVMITLPIFMPVIEALDINAVWFGLMLLVTLEMAGTSPPFGSYLFVMKGVAPPDTTMADVYKAGLPFLGCDFVAVALILAFPAIVLWLPSMMR